LTAAHCIHEAGEALYVDNIGDIALVKDVTPGPTVKLGTAMSSMVLLDHFPMKHHSFSEGRFLGEQWIIGKDSLVIDCNNAVETGSSGGAVFNSDNELVGLISSRGAFTGYAFAAGPETLRQALERLN